MRGQRKLFENFEQEVLAESPLPKKGRSPQLQEKRDALLVARFYFYTKTTKYRYEYILEILEIEFFLSKCRIVAVLDEQFVAVRKLHKEQPQVSIFKKEWPHLVW